mmetsp:Transcript_18527/g.57468  ORF Transcript_18527/g.57468 Transcript_18527/m.57468 type:complete len:296 (+) Transcript_18527:157-1044(+)
MTPARGLVAPRATIAPTKAFASSRFRNRKVGLSRSRTLAVSRTKKPHTLLWCRRKPCLSVSYRGVAINLPGRRSWRQDVVVLKFELDVAERALRPEDARRRLPPRAPEAVGRREDEAVRRAHGDGRVRGGGGEAHGFAALLGLGHVGVVGVGGVHVVAAVEACDGGQHVALHLEFRRLVVRLLVFGVRVRHVGGGARRRRRRAQLRHACELGRGCQLRRVFHMRGARLPHDTRHDEQARRDRGAPDHNGADDDARRGTARRAAVVAPVVLVDRGVATLRCDADGVGRGNSGDGEG